jgi:hypothetical protein
VGYRNRDSVLALRYKSGDFRHEGEEDLDRHLMDTPQGYCGFRDWQHEVLGRQESGLSCLIEKAQMWAAHLLERSDQPSFCFLERTLKASQAPPLLLFAVIMTVE